MAQSPRDDVEAIKRTLLSVQEIFDRELTDYSVLSWLGYGSALLIGFVLASVLFYFLRGSGSVFRYSKDLLIFTPSIVVVHWGKEVKALRVFDPSEWRIQYQCCECNAFVTPNNFQEHLWEHHPNLGRFEWEFSPPIPVGITINENP